MGERGVSGVKMLNPQAWVEGAYRWPSVNSMFREKLMCKLLGNNSLASQVK